MMKQCIILLLVSLTFLVGEHRSSATESSSVEEVILRAESIMTEMENNNGLKKYIPFDTYGDALLYVIYARNQLEVKDYGAASFYATLAIIKFEIATVLAQANKYDYDLVVRERDFYKNKKVIPVLKDNASALFEASMEKIGNVFRTQYLDKYIFDKKHKIADTGKQRLDAIVHVLEIYPSSTAVVISHSAEYDKANVTKHKSEMVRSYLISKGVDPQRLESIGLGNREVMETNLGYKKINRIEVVLKGIEY